ncbi:MAG: DNA primase [Acidobacteriaceae bacterium]|nr:DNA primase [Acidobacteriaceae bacterium]
MADDFAQLVKQQVDIVRIIGDYLKLRKTGAQNYTGLCPFHKEKTGSFSVNATHGYYYCFGCHEKGDVFNFVMKMEGLSFPEAVRSVATKAGIALPKREFSSPEDAREAGIRRQLIDLHEAATQYFEAQLRAPEAARAREYLTGRGISAETIKTFRIGYAPDDYNHMRDALRQHFSEEAMRVSGLFSAKEQADGSPGPMYSRFRKRITFPIANEAGRVIAFTARALDPDEKNAKYLNSPETPLYTKGNILFNLDKAKGEMRKSDFAVLVEGQMDCISVYMAGIRNVVATSGTAFTETQVRLLGRFTKRVIVNFDPDTAGATASEKSISLLTEEDFDVKLVTLEGGFDPDRFVREKGIQAYGAALREAKRHSDYLIERARQLFPSHAAEAKVSAMNFLLPHIRRMAHPIRRNQFAEDAANKLGIDSALMRQELKQAAAQRVASVPMHRSEPVTETERILLRALVLPESDPARARAATALAENSALIADLATTDLLDTLANAGVPSNPLDAAATDEARAQLAEVLEHSPQPTDPPLLTQVEDALHSLEERRLERRQRELRSQIAEADRRGDQTMLGQLIAEKIQIDRQLRQF